MNLSIRNLSKTYGNGVVALNDVSIDIPVGMFGLLGPNGAGKSTLMRTLATLQEADAGEIYLGDVNVLRDKIKVKQKLGYLPQEFGFYPRETAANLLAHLCLLKGVGGNNEVMKIVEALLIRVNLWNERNQKLGTFSGGMKQRFGIAQALLGNPKMIIVDEPTAGLDPIERNRFHNLLSEIGENIVVILSTHIVDDVSDLCKKMAIIHRGKIILNTDTLDAIQHFQDKIWEMEIQKSELPQYRQKHRLLSSRLYAGNTFIRVYAESAPGNGFKPVRPSLEDVYFYHIGAEA